MRKDQGMENDMKKADILVFLVVPKVHFVLAAA